MTTRWCRARNGTWAFQNREWMIDQVGISSTVVGPSPWTSHAISTPSGATTVPDRSGCRPRGDGFTRATLVIVLLPLPVGTPQGRTS